MVRNMSDTRKVCIQSPFAQNAPIFAYLLIFYSIHTHTTLNHEAERFLKLQK